MDDTYEDDAVVDLDADCDNQIDVADDDYDKEEL